MRAFRCGIHGISQHAPAGHVGKNRELPFYCFADHPPILAKIVSSMFLAGDTRSSPGQPDAIRPVDRRPKGQSPDNAGVLSRGGLGNAGGAPGSKPKQAAAPDPAYGGCGSRADPRRGRPCSRRPSRGVHAEGPHRGAAWGHAVRDASSSGLDVHGGDLAGLHHHVADGALEPRIRPHPASAHDLMMAGRHLGERNGAADGHGPV